MSVERVVLLDGARTAIGRFGGSLSEVEAHELGAHAISGALERSGIDAAEVDEVVMGQVGQVGADAYNARRCALAAGIRVGASAMNVNRLCGSGLQAIVTGAHQLLLEDVNVVVAGGDENMSRQPFLDYGGRSGWRLGNRHVVDGTLSLVTDPFGQYPMGETAERVAERFGVTREQQDEFALESQTRAARAQAAGVFRAQIVPVPLPGREEPFTEDEHLREGVTREALKGLRPAFRVDGTVTAGNSSGINDGAGAVVMMRESTAERRGLQPRLRFLGATVTGIEPEVMGYAPALAIPKLLDRLGIDLDEIGIIELNEAFAAQAVAIVRDVHLDQDRVNPDGGAIALGHPVGATGTILTVKLMHALELRGERLGLVSMCIGGGQGIAAVFESLKTR